MTKYEILKKKIEKCRSKMRKIVEEGRLNDFGMTAYYCHLANRVTRYELQLSYCAAELALKKYRQQVGA